MNEQIQSILHAGRKKLEAIRAESEAKYQVTVRTRQMIEQAERRAFFALVPETLHEFCTVGSDQICIALPGAARVMSNHNALEYQYENLEYGSADGMVVHRVVSAVQFAPWKRQRPWRIARWTADDEGEIYLRVVDEADELEVALALAVEMGDGREEAEEEARENAERARQEQREMEPPSICPLVHPDYHRGCVKEECMWFVQYRGVDQCAIKVLAVTAIHRAPDLE